MYTNLVRYNTTQDGYKEINISLKKVNYLKDKFHEHEVINELMRLFDYNLNYVNPIILFIEKFIKLLESSKHLYVTEFNKNYDIKVKQLLDIDFTIFYLGNGKYTIFVEHNDSKVKNTLNNLMYSSKVTLEDSLIHLINKDIKSNIENISLHYNIGKEVLPYIK